MSFLLGLFLGCVLGFLFAGLCSIAKTKTPAIPHHRMPERLEEVA
ncbi:MAG: hypothetical protein AB9866_27065 [Syntrophobacteraceae bacterium]